MRQKIYHDDNQNIDNFNENIDNMTWKTTLQDMQFVNAYKRRKF